MKLYDAGAIVIIIFVGLCVSGKYLYDNSNDFKDCVEEIVEDYNSDNLVENNYIEPYIEKKLGLEEDSLDISFWDDDEDKDWFEDR